MRLAIVIMMMMGMMMTIVMIITSQPHLSRDADDNDHGMIIVLSYW